MTVHRKSKSVTAKNICISVNESVQGFLQPIFNDGNKRASVIFANHYLISQGGGMIIIPEKYVPEFKKLLVAYYEDKETGEITEFMKSNCVKTF